MSDLLDAIDQLTKPTRSAVLQSNEAGIICTETTRIELPSLLDQLDNSIRSSMGGNSSGASLAFQGSPLNTAALFEAMKIMSELGSWCRGANLTPGKTPAGNLQAWHVATLSRVDWDDSWYVKQLHKWAGTITALLNPPREKDLPDSCPVCDASEWWKAGERFYRPLVIRYRADEPVGNATAMCRACAQTWNARELAFAIEQAEIRNAEEKGVA